MYIIRSCFCGHHDSSFSFLSWSCNHWGDRSRSTFFAMTPHSLSITFNRSSGGSRPAVGRLSNQTVVSAADCLAGKEPTVSILPKFSRVQQHPVFDPPADGDMTTILNQAKTKTLQIHHKGQQDGGRVRLQGVGSASGDVPNQGIQQNGYIITPSGANVGENISINGGGLVIRARNDKSQTITAKSTPDNQLQVQVGQGKSAVQLSIQVTPQGTRGEVELMCVRNAEGKGETTGYTVSVKRPGEEPCAYKQNQRANSPGRSNSPPEGTAYPPARSRGSPQRGQSSPESSPDRPQWSPEQSKKSPERRRNYSHAPQEHSDFSYGTEPCDLRDEAPSSYPVDRPQPLQAQTHRHELPRARNASSMKAPSQLKEPEEFAQGYDADPHYKRKLDTHHHKPTISFLIARRMTELFKEMRKTAQLHQPPPFVKF